MHAGLDAEYVARRDRLQRQAAEWIAAGGELAERGWRLFELLAWIERQPASSPRDAPPAGQEPPVGEKSTSLEMPFPVR